VISNQTQYDNSQYAQSVNGISEKNTYMTWTGLVFSGGNNAWKGFRIPNNVEDGILTADEISRLDLSSTQLVVLSACETARGHIDPVDGVWGLQRAFKQAGVSTILMTLWKIPDSTTSIFMEQFYQALVDGLSVRSAVKKAQKYLIYNGASDPFYWAPFVVLD
jgi:CHAT domain-containing protein